MEPDRWSMSRETWFVLTDPEGMRVVVRSSAIEYVRVDGEGFCELSMKSGKIVRVRVSQDEIMKLLGLHEFDLTKSSREPAP